MRLVGRVLVLDICPLSNKLWCERKGNGGMEIEISLWLVGHCFIPIVVAHDSSYIFIVIVSSFCGCSSCCHQDEVRKKYTLMHSIATNAVPSVMWFADG